MLKIFFRNLRAVFFVLFLPAAIFMVLAFLGLEAIIKFEFTASYKDFLLSGMIAMAIMQSGIYSVTYSLIDYQKRMILKRFAVTPLSAGKYWGALIITRFIIGFLQLIVLVVLGTLVFHTTAKGLWSLPILAFLGSTIFLNIGIMIAAAARDYEEAAPYTTITGLALIFFGDVFFPTGQLPHALSQIANFLPLKPLSQGLRYFLLEMPDGNLAVEILILLTWLLFSSLVASYIFRKKLFK